MSALFFRPVATYPVRCHAPTTIQYITRPSYPTVHDVAPLFSLFDESFAQLERVSRQARTQFKRPFNPKFNVKEAKESYLVEGELPGFDAKDISIEFLDDGHTLQIKGKTVKETKRGAEEQPKAVDDAQSEAAKSVEQAPAAEPAQSDASSVKSRQATVEDDVEEPGNASAAAEQPQQEQQQAVAETSSKPAEQQVAESSKKEADAKHWVSERHTGSFTRSFKFPSKVDQEAVKASLKDGILAILQAGLERHTGSFTRSFKFPSKVDQEAVKASLKDGILAITLPFASKPESRRIQIE